MRGERDGDPRLRKMSSDQPDAIVEVRDVLAEEVRVEGWRAVHYALGADEAFAEALARGFARFVGFLSAEKLNARAIGEPLLRKRVEAVASHLR
ncbi:hypothetical protein [Limnochorda pilosa]|uniref:Uncharacterized protein n=1 Tax=Limnochorda pilosa TaxID=1555112 RepID=A0A0K2SII8_LIMPI|nr:hypothetical protein [Limnochorda pilosa]BAS26837.1 hypothetical protein LIP_0980 [Limnochorda pilosa]